MTAIATRPNVYLEDFERFVEGRADAPWLAALRTAAIDRFVQRGFPTARDEDWIYTNVAPLAKRRFERARAIQTPEAPTLEGLLLDLTAGPRLVFVNGHFDPQLSDETGLPAGAWLGSLAHALATRPEAVRSHLERETQPHAFADLNTAFCEDGAVLHLPRGAVAEQPIEVVFVMTSWQNDVVEHPRLIVVADENSEATLLERYEAQGPGDRFTNAVTEIRLAANATLRHTRIQREGSQAFHVGVTRLWQERDSTYAGTVVSLGGAICRQEIHVELVEPGADCALHGLYVLGGHEHVDNHTFIQHRVPHCRSEELYKGILGGHATGAFTGRIVVHPGAQKTDARQANHNLLLSHDALAETRPQLEIYADDVKCAHGATIGQLDEEAAFYLRSRGLGPMAARNLLIHGFASEVSGAVADESIRSGVERVLASRLQVDASEAGTSE